ncbi:MAG: hypothetical protein HFF15_05580 [Angelakisella sp.]|jgi:hypothetical protein|nr:hypothetical protein [Angelakisella sp.]
MDWQEQEKLRGGDDYGPWSQWQEAWFGTPGDLDDFIFFYDGQEEAVQREE